MDFNVLRDVPIDRIEKLAKLDATVTPMILGNDLPLMLRAAKSELVP